MENEHSTKKQGRRLGWLWLIVLVIVIAAPVLFLLATNRLAFILKDPEQTVVVQTTVCGDEEIERANQFSTTDMTDEQFKELVDKIKTKPDYSSDPTCLSIAAQYYFMFSDITQIQEIYSQMKTLNEQGLYPNNRLDNPITLNELAQYLVNNLKSEDQ